MLDDKLPITGTTHTLPFDKLSPRDFERLCLWLVEREGYEGAKHLGAAGKEQGRDIVAWREGALWAFQCKRVRSFGPKDALAEVEKVLTLPEAERPVGLVFLVTCDVSANTRQQARAGCAGEMACDFWAGTELDVKVKQHREIVDEFFRAVGTRISPWGLAILAAGLVLAFALAAAISNISALQGLLPTPIAFDPAGEGQSLIIVADFDDRSGDKYQGVDPAQYIYEKLMAQAQADGLEVRIERLRQAVDNNTARPTGEVYNATLVLWGWYDALTITPRMERIKTLSEYRSTEEGQHLSLADLGKVEFSIITDLPSQVTYLTLFTLGVDEFTNGNNDEALAYVGSALAAIPTAVEVSTSPSEAYLLRGIIYHAATEYEAALADYTHALELNPGYAVTYYNRGITYHIMGEYKTALADYTRALELNPEFAAAYNNRGNTYGDMGEYEAALADYTRALELNPEYAAAYYNQGSIYGGMGEYEAALADYTRALELNPEYAAAYNNRGAICHDIGEYEAALADYTRALELNPRYAKAYNNRGNTYYDMGEYEAALADYTRALKLNPEYAKAYYIRGNTYYNMGEYEAALADYTRALELNPEYAEAYNNRGGIYYALGEYDTALADYTRALELEPEKADAHWGTGQVYGAQSKYEKATQAYSRAIEFDPQFVNAYLNRGGNYSDIGEYELALQDYAKVIELDPRNALVYQYRGITYRKLGDAEKAIADFERFLELSTDPYWREQAEEHLRELRGE